ncbi:hypothetical protein [Cytobacillus gottheilii]|uniref:Uncharacterized protein n=1 Tax=Cytobacillus gottheilii TaxID=859144 RepID=A0ABX8F9S4_9BACI|nr:hypothetical protein [Cytobacillus gottheilii]QVY60919.1 hypothetical protein J1899_18390 [Cytobacillus gottheilii]
MDDVVERLDNHEDRIKSLEEYRLQQEKVNLEIKSQLTATEMTVIKESNKQQEMTKQLLDHVLNSKRFTQEQFWKFTGAAAGTGGLLYLIFEAFVNKQ